MASTRWRWWSSSPPEELAAHHGQLVEEDEGKVPQWYAPIVGADKVARLFAEMGRQMLGAGASFESHRINGQPGAVFRGPRGGVFSVMSIEVVARRIATIRSVVNPDKLGHLGRVESLRVVLNGPSRARP